MNLYVSLAEAKAHLRITDNDHDPEVQATADRAVAVILDYVAKGRTRFPDPTVPAPLTPDGLIVQSAALDFLGSLYEHRGDDYGINTPDAEVWQAIRRKLARLRNPAFA